MKNSNIFQRFGYALAGLIASVRSERSFRLEVIYYALVLVLLLMTRPAPVWWAILLLACGAVLAVELINTAVEKLIDHLHPDQHRIIGVVKDTLAGAVLVTVVTALAVLAAFFCSQMG